MSLSLGIPPPLTQNITAKRLAAPTHECTGPAIYGPRRIATEEKGRVSRTATGQPETGFWCIFIPLGTLRYLSPGETLIEQVHCQTTSLFPL